MRTGSGSWSGWRGGLCPGAAPEAPLDPRLRFATVVGLADREGQARRGVEFVVIHRFGHHGEVEAVVRRPLEVGPALAWCRDAFGPPVFEDGEAVVFATRPP